jgi:nicotinamide-nucleotide amidase
MWFYENKTVFVSLPGVPNEMKGLMTDKVLPKIQQQFKLPFIIHKTIITYGLGESSLAERIEDFENNLPSFIKLAYLPNYGKVRLRLSAKGDDKKLLEDSLEEQIAVLYKIIPDIITGIGEDGEIEKRVGVLLAKSGKSVCTAESLTGGKIASTIVSVPGSSAYYKGGFVTYSAETKINLLGVSKQTIEKYSVVSKEVAKEMAIGAKEKLQTNYAIAVTGNAGPTTDHNDKSVGIVFIALAAGKEVVVKEFNFGKPRGRVIDKTVNESLDMLQKEILKNF